MSGFFTRCKKGLCHGSCSLFFQYIFFPFHPFYSMVLFFFLPDYQFLLMLQEKKYPEHDLFLNWMHAFSVYDFESLARKSKIDKPS